MRIVLDTGVFWRSEVVERLAPAEENIVLPAIAYAERTRQLRARGLTTEPFDRWLDEAGVVVEPFERSQARRIPGPAIVDRIWRRLARDAMIASHLRPGDVIWTTNPRHFALLGIPREQVVDVS